MTNVLRSEVKTPTCKSFPSQPSLWVCSVMAKGTIQLLHQALEPWGLSKTLQMVAEHSQNKGRLFTQKQGTVPFRAAILQENTVWRMLNICKNIVGWYYDLWCAIQVLALSTNTNFKQLFFHYLVTTKNWIKLINSNYTLWVFLCIIYWTFSEIITSKRQAC